MFDLSAAPVHIRADLPAAFDRAWARLAEPGGVLAGPQRVNVASVARGGAADTVLHEFAALLYSEPGKVEEEHVNAASDASGYPATVETIGIVSRLSAVDRFHSVMGLDRPTLPQPAAGEPTGEVRNDLKKRRGLVPMPLGPIPVSLDLVPAEGRAMLDLHGPMYMTERDMANPGFRRTPGLSRPQLELVAARTSFINDCFY